MYRHIHFDLLFKKNQHSLDIVRFTLTELKNSWSSPVLQGVTAVHWSGSTPGWGTFTCHGLSQKNTKNKKQNMSLWSVWRKEILFLPFQRLCWILLIHSIEMTILQALIGPSTDNTVVNKTDKNYYFIDQMCFWRILEVTAVNLVTISKVESAMWMI